MDLNSGLLLLVPGNTETIPWERGYQKPSGVPLAVPVPSSQLASLPKQHIVDLGVG